MTNPHASAVAVRIEEAIWHELPEKCNYDAILIRSVIDRELEGVRKAMGSLLWPNVPSADDMAILSVMASGTGDRHAGVMELIERLRAAQANGDLVLQQLTPPDAEKGEGR
jgi:hypothetical protein